MKQWFWASNAIGMLLLLFGIQQMFFIDGIGDSHTPIALIINAIVIFVFVNAPANVPRK